MMPAQGGVGAVAGGMGVAGKPVGVLLEEEEQLDSASTLAAAFTNGKGPKVLIPSLGAKSDGDLED